ncbi:MAG: hypothetical protein FWH11_05045 [Micrococcales bacterium]|nr:hypothetical protein [Micrococcales bacterium]
MRKTLAAVMTAGIIMLGGVVAAQPAAAAGCTYANLSSTKVQNKTCTYGAYAYKGSNNTWYQNGNWVTKSKYSYNWSALCFVNPGMLGIV